MKHLRLTAFLLTVCLLLAACVQQPQQGNNGQNVPPVSNEQQPPVQNDDPSVPAPDDGKNDTPAPTFPSDITVELVVDSETANALLSQLDALAENLRRALVDVGCPLDIVTLSFSTAGAYTADSLVDGGISAAILPAVDIIAAEKRVSIIALSSEEIPETAIALTCASDNFSEEFYAIFFKALMESPSGQAFLSACCTDAVFSAPTEEGLQAVRNYLAELEKNGGGHER